MCWLVVVGVAKVSRGMVWNAEAQCRLPRQLFMGASLRSEVNKTTLNSRKAIHTIDANQHGYCLCYKYS